MGRAELHVFQCLFAVIAITTTSTCWGVWRVLTDLRNMQRHIYGYRDTLD